MGHPRNLLLIVASVLYFDIVPATACSDGGCQLKDKCQFDKDCAVGLYCFKSCNTFDQYCAKSTFSNPFKINNSLPFNKYAFLTSHNSYATYAKSYSWKGGFSGGHEDLSVTKQLNSGVRALMLNTFDYEDNVWLCHDCGNRSIFSFASVGPALDLFKEVKEFLTSNPSEIITLILEDSVKAPKGLAKLFDAVGLTQYLFPLSKMPQYGRGWPSVEHMVVNNQRLVVFTSAKSKQESEGIAYQWNFMIEYKYGSEGLQIGSSTKDEGSLKLDNTSKSLVLVDYSPLSFTPCNEMNIEHLMNTLRTSYTEAGNRWANFIAIDYKKRRDGGGTFQAVDFLNGMLLCMCDDVNSCKGGGERFQVSMDELERFQVSMDEL